MVSIRTWSQNNVIEINEVDYDHDAHAFEISIDGKNVVTIYANSPEQTEDMRASLDDGDDVMGWEDGNGNCVGSLIGGV